MASASQHIVAALLKGKFGDADTLYASAEGELALAERAWISAYSEYWRKAATCVAMQG